MTAPLRLLMTADSVGGVFTYALDLAAALRPHAVETTLVLLGPAMSAGQREAAVAAGVPVVETELPLEWLAEDAASIAAAPAAVAALARRLGADVVHLNTPALADGPYGAPVVAVVHSCLATWWVAVKEGTPPEDFRWRTELTARGLAAAHAVVCPSRAFAAIVAAAYGIAPIAVPNGRSAASLAPFGAPVAAALTAGRLWDEGKNVATLDAAAGLVDLPVRAAGPLAGPNGARVTCRHLDWLGQLDEPAMRRAFAARPIFVSAALYEPFGLTALEAAQAGAALVLSDIPTFRELWAEAAVLVPSREPEAFAAALTALAGDEVRRAALGEAARERARLYTAEAMAERMAGIYRALAEGREPRPAVPHTAMGPIGRRTASREAMA